MEIKNPETDPYKYGQVIIFGKGTLAIQWRKYGVGKVRYPCAKKKKKILYFSLTLI